MVSEFTSFVALSIIHGQVTLLKAGSMTGLGSVNNLACRANYLFTAVYTFICRENIIIIIFIADIFYAASFSQRKTTVEIGVGKTDVTISTDAGIILLCANIATLIESIIMKTSCAVHLCHCAMDDCDKQENLCWGYHFCELNCSLPLIVRLTFTDNKNVLINIIIPLKYLSIKKGFIVLLSNNFIQL